MAKFRTRFRGGVIEGVFERDKLTRRQERRADATMKRIGGFYLTVVKRSMRNGNLKRGAVSSKPGQPPRYHTKTLRDGMNFVYDPNSQTVTVGVLPRRTEDKSAPRVLEFGGRTGRKDIYRQVQSRNRRGQFTQKAYRKVGEGSVQVAPRPYLGERSINWPKVIKRLQRDRSKMGI